MQATIDCNRACDTLNQKGEAMNDVQRMIEKVLDNTSPRELDYLKKEDYSVAIWLVDHILEGLTPTQAESVAYRVLDHVK